MRYEVMVRAATGGMVVHSSGDTGTSTVAFRVEAAEADESVTYLGVAVDGVREHLWPVAVVERAMGEETLEALAGEARWRRWVDPVRGVLAAREEPVAVSDVALWVGGDVGEVGRAVEALAVEGVVLPVGEDGSRVEPSPFGVAPRR